MKRLGPISLPQDHPSDYARRLAVELFKLFGADRDQINEFIVKAAFLAEDNIFTAAQTVTPVALTDAATIATDAGLSNTFTVTLGGNRTLANPSNLADGGIYNWRITQDGTGGRTLVYGSKFKWPGGSAPVLSTGAGAVDYIAGQYFSGTDVLLCNILKGMA